MPLSAHARPRDKVLAAKQVGLYVPLNPHPFLKTKVAIKFLNFFFFFWGGGGAENLLGAERVNDIKVNYIQKLMKTNKRI